MNLRNVVTTILLCICCLSNVLVFAQEQEEYRLTVFAEWNGTSWDENIYLSTTQVFDAALSGQNVIIQRDSELLIPCGLIEIGGSTVAANWGDIKELEVRLVANDKETWYGDTARLTDVFSLAFCSFDSIRSLTIDYSSFGYEIIMNLNDWHPFQNMKSASKLSKFRLLGAYSPHFNLSQLIGLPIEYLELPLTSGVELLCFPHLKELVLPKALDGFCHYIGMISEDTDVNTLQSSYYNRFNYLFAENYYNLVSNHGILNQILEEYRSTYPDKWEDKGQLLIKVGELDQFHMEADKSATLVSGKLKKGKPVGDWIINISGPWNMIGMPPFQVDMKMKPKLVKDGKWSLRYLDGTVAIEGSFVGGKKDGDWKFYDNYGTLKCIRTFHRDTLKNTVVMFDMRGVPLESRAYYFNENQSIQTFQSEGKVSFMYYDAVPNNKRKMEITENAISFLKEDGSYEIVTRKNPLFGELMRREVIDLVYPEFVGAELPFKF